MTIDLVHTSFSQLKSWFTLYLSKLSHNQKTQPCLTSACDGLPYLTLNFEVWNPQYNSTIKNLPSNNFAKKLKNKSKAYKSYSTVTLSSLFSFCLHMSFIWWLIHSVKQNMSQSKISSLFQQNAWCQSNKKKLRFQFLKKSNNSLLIYFIKLSSLFAQRSYIWL